MEKKPFSPNELKKPREFKPSEIRAEEKVLKTFTCPICLNLVNDPLFCKNCGAAACRKCLVEYYKSQNQNQQSQCFNKCGGNSYRKITFKEKEFIDYIKLRCKHNGCFQFISYTDYDQHLEKCKYRVYHCDNLPCKEEGLLPQMEEHAKRCIYRPIECEKCKKKILYNNKENHLNQECPETMVKCIFCEKKMKRIDYIKKHVTNDASCLKKELDLCQKKINELETDLKQQINQVKKLKNDIKDNEKKLTEKDKEIDELKDSRKKLRQRNANKNKLIEEFTAFLNDGYEKFIKKDNVDDKPLNINNEIQKKETQDKNIMLNSEVNNLPKKENQNLYLNTDTNSLSIKDNQSQNLFSTSSKNSFQKKEISGRNRIQSNFNNYSNLTERKTSKGMRRINSEANFTNFNIK